MKKFWIGNLALSLLLVIVYLTISHTGIKFAYTLQAVHIMLYVSVVQLFAETICAILCIDRQTRLDIVFCISSILFSVLIALFLWPLVYNAAI